MRIKAVSYDYKKKSLSMPSFILMNVCMSSKKLYLWSKTKLNLFRIVIMTHRETIINVLQNL